MPTPDSNQPNDMFYSLAITFKINLADSLHPLVPYFCTKLFPLKRSQIMIFVIFQATKCGFFGSRIFMPRKFCYILDFSWRLGIFISGIGNFWKSGDFYSRDFELLISGIFHQKATSDQELMNFHILAPFIH